MIVVLDTVLTNGTLLNFTQDSPICQRFLISHWDCSQIAESHEWVNMLDLLEPVYGHYLEIIPAEGEIYTLSLPHDGEIVVGRSRNQCRLMLDDPRISRVHLRITCLVSQQIVVMDLHTANGSRLDNRCLPPGMPMTWLINQPIIIGSTHLILRYGVLES
jgi:FHA domain-containing protein